MHLKQQKHKLSLDNYDKTADMEAQQKIIQKIETEHCKAESVQKLRQSTRQSEELKEEEEE